MILGIPPAYNGLLLCVRSPGATTRTLWQPPGWTALLRRPTQTLVWQRATPRPRSPRPRSTAPPSCPRSTPPPPPPPSCLRPESPAGPVQPEHEDSSPASRTARRCWTRRTASSVSILQKVQNKKKKKVHTGNDHPAAGLQLRQTSIKAVSSYQRLSNNKQNEFFSESIIT